MPRAALDADAFTQAFAQHGRTLWVIASAWVGRTDAADLVQETARVAWERRDQFAVGTDVRAWLAQIVRHTGANWRRRLRPEPLADGELNERAAPAAASAVEGPFDADRCGLGDELARPLAALSEPARACLLLQVVLGHSFAEIASMLGMPENTAMSHARRARLALKAALSGGTAEATAAEMP